MATKPTAPIKKVRKFNKQTYGKRKKLIIAAVISIFLFVALIVSIILYKYFTKPEPAASSHTPSTPSSTNTYCSRTFPADELYKDADRKILNDEAIKTLASQTNSAEGIIKVNDSDTKELDPLFTEVINNIKNTKDKIKSDKSLSNMTAPGVYKLWMETMTFIESHYKNRVSSGKGYTKTYATRIENIKIILYDVIELKNIVFELLSNNNAIPEIQAKNETMDDVYRNIEKVYTQILNNLMTSLKDSKSTSSLKIEVELFEPFIYINIVTVILWQLRVDTNGKFGECLSLIKENSKNASIDESMINKVIINLKHYMNSAVSEFTKILGEGRDEKGFIEDVSNSVRALEILLRIENSASEAEI